MEKDDAKGTAGRRPETRFLVYAEHWIFGSTRAELLPDERSVWTDFMSLAALNGNMIDFTFPEQVANSLNISLELLERTIKKFIKYKKIRFKHKKSENKTYICLVKWKKYQPAYLWNRPEKSIRWKRVAKDPGSDAHVFHKGKERKGEDKKEEELREDEDRKTPENSPSISPPLPSKEKEKDFTKGKTNTMKAVFLDVLRECPGYPFNEAADGILFDIAVTNFPGVNLLEQTQKKVAWWKEHLGALEADPRGQLKKFFSEEKEFKKRGGPMTVGEVLIQDKDHAHFLEGMISLKKKKKEDEI